MLFFDILTTHSNGLTSLQVEKTENFQDTNKTKTNNNVAVNGL